MYYQKINKITLSAIIVLPFLYAFSFSADAKTATDEQKIAKVIAENRLELFDDPLSPRTGNARARVVLVSFIDYNCSVCRKFDPQLFELVKKHPEIAIVFKPLAFRHQSSEYAAQAALNVWKTHPQSFVKFHQRLMEKRGAHDVVSVTSALHESLDVPLQAQDSSEQVLKRNQQLAEKLGVWGTPATLFGNTLLTGTAPQSELDQAAKILLNDN